MSQNDAAVDLLTIPPDGLAAYWLSLRKLVGSARNLKALEDEAAFAADAYIRHLLHMALSPLPAAKIKELAEVSALHEGLRLDRRLDLMRVAVMDIAQGENPLRTLAKLLACFPQPPEQPEKMLETAQVWLNKAHGKKGNRDVYSTHPRQADGPLCTTLLFYVQLARRHGRPACRPFLPQCGSAFFADSMALVIDGFDVPFVRKWMKKNKETITADIRRKMALSADLCLAIHERMPFDDMVYIVRSHLR